MYRPHPQVLTVLGVVFVDVLGLTVMIPLLPFYAQHFGATPAGVGASKAVNRSRFLRLDAWIESPSSPPTLSAITASLMGSLPVMKKPRPWHCANTS